MRTLTADRPTTTPTADVVATPEAIRVTRRLAEVVEDYVPSHRDAPRSARRIAMQVRHEQDYRLTGW